MNDVELLKGSKEEKMMKKTNGLIGKGLLLAAVVLVAAFAWVTAGSATFLFEGLNKAGSKAEKISCHNHLKMINLHQQMWADDNGKALSTKVTLDDLKANSSRTFGMEQSKWDRMTNCPGGGDYRLTTVQEQPTCSVHGTFVPRKAGLKTASSR